MNKKIRRSITLAIAGIILLVIGFVGGYSVNADSLKSYQDTLVQGSWIAIVAGVILIILSLLFFVMASSVSDKK